MGLRVAQRDGIFLKKKLGQHFLRDSNVTERMIARVNVKEMPVLEIGCGDGFLTREILKQPIKKVQVFEIDAEWADYVRKSVHDQRLVVDNVDVLRADFETLRADAPWTILANLPYQVTFPILHRIQEYRALFKEGVIMIQEEVAQKIVKQGGRGYGYPALFFQHYFEWELLQLVPPTAFFPPPKINSRLLYFKPRVITDPIPDETQFWKFIRQCFSQPRRMLKNNLAGSIYDAEKIPDQFTALRAQQMSMTDLRMVWDVVKI
jgi:16S rRNA (adenine1518-N6/adenine1519-N6)-dimethyltransferase